MSAIEPNLQHGEEGTGSAAAEAPLSRGERVAGALRWALVAAAGLLAAWSILALPDAPTASPEASTAVFSCPMHPAIRQDHPGDCPICKMTLVPSAPEPRRSIFTCPMHPTIVSDAPGVCPICKMALEPRSVSGAVATSSSGVPGLVPVELSKERLQLGGIATERVERVRLGQAIRAPAELAVDESRRTVVQARFSGWIEALSVSAPGVEVEAGQVLAQIHSPELLAAQHELLSARDWRGSAAERGAASEGAEVAMESAARRRLELYGISSADIEALLARKEPLRSVAVRAPVGGRVLGKAVVRGMYVEAGAPLFELADLSVVWAQAEVEARDIATLKPRQPARAFVTALPGRSWAGRVASIEPVLGTLTRTLRVRIPLANPDGALLPGMFGEVELEGPSREVTAISREALIDTGRQQYVFVAGDGGRLEPRRVGTGLITRDRVEIVSGLSPGETVISTGNFLVDSESRLQAALQGMAEVAPAEPGGAR
jgi:Cu(I)/Ag(I) efflux system membrane fusion protein